MVEFNCIACAEQVTAIAGMAADRHKLCNACYWRLVEVGVCGTNNDPTRVTIAHCKLPAGHIEPCMY